MSAKFELSNSAKIVDGVTVYRVRALRDVTTRVRAGDLGGWLQYEGNLSQGGTCWVSHDAIVTGSASVSGDAHVRSYARVGGCAQVRDDAVVAGSARVHGNASLRDHTYVVDSAEVGGYAVLQDRCRVGDEARVLGGVSLRGVTSVTDDAVVNGDVEHVTLRDAVLCEGAVIRRSGEAITLSGFLEQAVTLYRAPKLDGGHRLVAGCQVLSLTDPAGLVETAERHDWDLPPGWRQLRVALLTAVRAWTAA